MSGGATSGRPIGRLNKKAIQRFESKFSRRGKDECWEWKGVPMSTGYGLFSVRFRRMLAHRVSWTLFRGPVTAGLCVLHMCDNRICVNPNHLFLGTRTDNNRDMWSKGRGVTHVVSGTSHYNGKKDRCKRGHRFTEANTYTYRGRRNCRACDRIRRRRHREAEA